MSSVTGSRGNHVREAAKVVAKQNGIQSVFLEGHTAVPVMNEVHLGEGLLLIFEDTVAISSEKFRFFTKVLAIEDLKVLSTTVSELRLAIFDDRVMDLVLHDMDRADEVGRLIHFLVCKHLGKLDKRIKKALEQIPINGVYARALARYPQHHHDLWSLFGVHTILHMPDGKIAPIPELPGEAALEASGEVDLVLGHHVFRGLEIHSLNDELGILTGKYDEGVITEVEETEMMCYVTSQALCISGPVDPLPLKLQYKHMYAVVEFVLSTNNTQEPGIRISYFEDGVFNSFILYAFENDLAFETALHEITLAWAQWYNRNYNIGDVFPLLDNADLMNIVFHFRQIDKHGYGLVPKEDLVQALAPLSLDVDAADVLYDMFDLCIVEVDKPYTQFQKYMHAMRTLICGSMEDKSDLLFRMLDYHRNGWFARSEFAWVMSAMARNIGAWTLREGFTQQDYTSWLFEVIDKDRDGYVTWEEMVYALQEDPTVREAWTAMGLAPPKERESRLLRRVGSRFVHAGHPQFALCCALQQGIEVACTVQALEDDEDDPFVEALTYDIEGRQHIPSYENDWQLQEDPPDWLGDYPIGSRVEIKDMELDRRFNGKEGIVIDYDIPAGFVIVHLFDPGAGYRVGPRNLELKFAAPQQTADLRNIEPGTDPGVCFQQKPTNLLIIAGVVPGSAADEASLIPGYVVERIDGYRMKSKQMAEEYIEAWKASGNTRIVIDISIPQNPMEQFYECGTRVEMMGLVEMQEYNGKLGVVVATDNSDNVYVLLDTVIPPTQKRVPAYHIKLARTSVVLKKRLIVEPAGLFGIEFDTKPGYPVFVRSVYPGGPADLAGVPVGAVVKSINGTATPNIEKTEKAVKTWQYSDTADCIVEVVVPDTGKTIPHPDKPICGDRSTITEYAGRVFQQLRTDLDIDRDDYLQSIGLSSAKACLWTVHLRSFIEVKPNSMWFTTFDEKFTINGLMHEQFQTLSLALPQYFEYLKSNPDTLISKYIGLYSMFWRGADTYFSVKLNIFPVPHQPISKVFTVDPVNEEAFKAEIRLSPVARKMIVDQFNRDCEFLTSIGSIGYTLVIGVHTVYNEVEGGSEKKGPMEKKGPEVRVEQARRMLLGNPCFSSTHVLQSYKINRPLVPVFSRKHHMPLPHPDERPKKLQEARNSRLKFFPHLAHTEEFEPSDYTVTASDSDAPISDSEAEDEDDADFNDDELEAFYERLAEMDKTVDEARTAVDEKQKELDKLSKAAEPFEVRKLKKKLAEHRKGVEDEEAELAKIQKKKKKNKKDEKRVEDLNTKLQQASIIEGGMEDELKAAKAAARPEEMDQVEKDLTELQTALTAAEEQRAKIKGEAEAFRLGHFEEVDEELKLVGSEKEDIMQDLLDLMTKVEGPDESFQQVHLEVIEVEKNIKKLQDEAKKAQTASDTQKGKVTEKKAKADDKLTKAQDALTILVDKAGGDDWKNDKKLDKELKKKLTKAQKDADKNQAAVDKLQKELDAIEEKMNDEQQQAKDAIDDEKYEKEKLVASLLNALGDLQTDEMKELKKTIRDKAVEWGKINKKLTYYETDHDYAQLIKDKEAVEERAQAERVAAELAPLDGKPPDGWKCQYCGNHNAWQVTTMGGVQPACTRCYRDYDRACAEPRDMVKATVDLEYDFLLRDRPGQDVEVEESGLGPVPPSRGGRAAPDAHAAASPSHILAADPDAPFLSEDEEEEEETWEEPEPSAGSEGESIADIEKFEDPFSSAAAPGPPLAPQFAKAPKDIPVQPGQGSPKRNVYQKFYGGIPGRLVPPGDVRSYTVGGLDTEIFYFGITDILTEQPPEVAAEYAEEFKDMIDGIFI
eukprot:TRINITY_DN13993_c0_g1_i1.p1 TRINITY_DN13993_c0_g1~~TRINITY_DN13993_c0_g1_i1.p1  ORF type:complete len:1829 (+),score=525.27 TRINITY_DN13993_c0_g1_i1:1125-6611(+)